MKIAIVGGVAGGASAASRARRLSEAAEIIVFERGHDPSFANCGLPYYIGGEIVDRQKLLVPARLSGHGFSRKPATTSPISAAATSPIVKQDMKQTNRLERNDEMCDQQQNQNRNVEPTNTASDLIRLEPATAMATAAPRLNEPAPDFEAVTTHGIKKLADYRGRWLVLFSHPSDFTPVCTTEFIAFARSHPKFQGIQCDLLGLSIDSVFSHIAWVRNIKEKFDVEIPFPIIEDLSMNVAHAYGMVQPGASDTSAVRAVFVIDAEGMLRAMLYYPMSNGRSVDEILRLVQALQTSDRQKVATPEGWKPGAKVIVPPPKTSAEADRRAKNGGADCLDWYFCQREAEEPLVAIH